MPRLAHAARHTQVVRPGVDDGAHLDACVGQVDRRGVGAVVAGEDDGRTTGQNAVAVQEGASGAREHDAGPVVVGEDDGPLVSARRHEHAPCADAPDALPRQVARRCAAEVVGAPLQREDEPVVEVPERGGALQVQDVGETGQLGGGSWTQSSAGPSSMRSAPPSSDPPASDWSSTSDDPGARPRCGQRGTEAGGPGTHHEEVGVDVPGVVAGGVGDLGEASPPR